MSSQEGGTARTRRRAGVLGAWLRRAGWLGYAVAVGGFVVGAAGRFTPVGVTLIVIALVAGSALLLPGIVIGLGISAAERDERKL
ncbi:MAG TPA: hypothetical protein VMY88_10605 [Acidimicrobiales bacterium]|nr:hypothetical protein [Acidimicrobiales bacterium]